MVLLIVPLQHLLLELNADTLAVLPQDTFRVIQQVIGVDDADLDFAVLAIRNTILLGVTLAANLGSDEASVLAVVEESTQLDVSSLARHERVEAGPLHQRRDAAAVIAWNSELRVADQKGEVEALQDLPRHDGRVTRLGRRVVGERRALRRAVGGSAVHIDAGVPGGQRPLEAKTETAMLVELIFGADATPDLLERRSEVRLLVLRRDQVVGDVLDEDTLALMIVSIRYSRPST